MHADTSGGVWRCFVWFLSFCFAFFCVKVVSIGPLVVLVILPRALCLCGCASLHWWWSSSMHSGVKLCKVKGQSFVFVLRFATRLDRRSAIHQNLIRHHCSSTRHTGADATMQEEKHERKRTGPEDRCSLIKSWFFVYCLVVGYTYVVCTHLWLLFCGIRTNR